MERGVNMDRPSLQSLVRHYGGQAGWEGEREEREWLMVHG
jgi:hypothetical protein